MDFWHGAVLSVVAGVYIYALAIGAALVL